MGVALERRELADRRVNWSNIEVNALIDACMKEWTREFMSKWMDGGK